MGRIRTIKPEFPQSESMGRVSRDARLCFIMLWTLADDAGRLRGNSRMLASLLFPYDDDAKKSIDRWLAELERERCVVRYEVDGDAYLQISAWLTHQKIDKPSASKIPAPPERCDDDSRKLARIREASALDQGVDQGVDQGEEETTIDSADGVKPFDRFWKAYPRKVGKDAARKAFERRKPTEALLQAMLTAIEAQRASEQWQRDGGQFIPHPATWLNEGRWQDEVPVGGQSPAESWWMTRSGIERMGSELGLGQWDQDAAERGRGEQFAAYEARVYRHAGDGPWNARAKAGLGAGVVKAVAA